jgi:glutaminyl-tRNA synthetase
MSISKTEPETTESGQPVASNFVREIILDDLKTNKFGGRVHTRFPPEPNGYLHIGHAKSINLNFGLAEEFGGQCNLRFDDTNPSKEETEYVDSIIEDARWLGGDWGDRLFYASDYFPQLYDWAVQLIQDGKAFVCDLSGDEVRKQRGTLTEPGQESPYRNRSGRRADAARQDRHGLAESKPARSHHVPHPACRASPHRQRMVNLSDVRFRARPIRLN